MQFLYSRKTLIIAEPDHVCTSVKAFAPATVANLGLGFDFLGCVIDGIGDYVSLHIDPNVHPGEISISDIQGIGSSTKKLCKNPLWNCTGIVAIAVMKMLGVRLVGLSLSLEEGLPLGSELGSSAASAAAATVAVNEIFGGKLGVTELVHARLESDAKISGYHADNVPPEIMGGFVLIWSYDPLELMQLRFPMDTDFFFVRVSPEFEAPTKKMRATLPLVIGMSHHMWNCRQTGAFGCTISGAGPTAVAVSVLKGGLGGGRSPLLPPFSRRFI